VDDPNGTIFRLGFTVDEVNTLLEVVKAIRPFQDKLRELKELVEEQDYSKAEEMRVSIKVPASLSELGEVFDSGGSLEEALSAKDKKTALQVLEDAERQVQDFIENAIKEG
jgi:hypothetical protein